MKKKFLLGGAVALFVTFAAFAAGMNYVRLIDTDKYCNNRCKINDTERVCGKCGGFMAGQGATYVEGTTAQYDEWFKCNKCNHVSKWRYGVKKI